MKVYLDDIREAPEGWVCVRTYTDMISMVDSFVIEELSLDHDLGEEKTGYDILCYMEEKKSREPHYLLPNEITIHTSNPVGRAKMMQAIFSLERFRGFV